jgi:hypothetical protein
MDWVIVAASAFTVSLVLEIAKWMERRGWFGSLAAKNGAHRVARPGT